MNKLKYVVDNINDINFHCEYKCSTMLSVGNFPFGRSSIYRLVKNNSYSVRFINSSSKYMLIIPYLYQDEYLVIFDIDLINICNDIYENDKMFILIDNSENVLIIDKGIGFDNIISNIKDIIFNLLL